MAEWLRVRAFARRRPGAFLGGAVVAGLVVGRLAKAGEAAQPFDGGRQAPAREESSPLPQGTVRQELPGYPGV